MNGKNNKVLKAGLAYTISNFLVKGMSFLTMPIFTRIMSSEDIGQFSNVSTWFGILAILTTFELFSSINIARFDFKEDLDSYISSILILGTVITAIFYIIILCNHIFFERLFSMDFFTINVLFIYLLFYPAIQTFQIRCRIDYDYKGVMIVSLISSLLSCLASLVCVLVMKDKLCGRILGNYIPLIIIAIVIYFSFFKRNTRISIKFWRYSLVVSIPLVWHLLAGNLLISSDQVMITRFLGNKANGYYSVAYTCAMVVSLLWTSLNSAWSPWAYEMMDGKKYNELYKKSKPYLLFFLILVILFMLFAPEILLIIGGDSYLEAVYVIPPVMVGYVFQFIYSFYINIEYYHKKQKFMAIGTTIAALINIGLNFWLIPHFGYYAAAYTTLIGYIVLFLIHFFIVRKMGYAYWYDTRFFIAALIMMCIFMLGCNVLYNNLMLRIMVIVVLVLLFIITVAKNKKKVENAIKKIVKT